MSQSASDNQPAPFDFEGLISPRPSFDQLFSAAALRSTYLDRFSRSPAKGIDRRNGYQLRSGLDAEVASLSKKCLDGEHRFTPYLERLQPKGRDKCPRVISVPAIRDRLVLHQLKEFLTAWVPNSSPKRLANSFVPEIAKALSVTQGRGMRIYGCDVKDFYGSVRRPLLIDVLNAHSLDARAVRLVRSALATPTVPQNARRSDYKKYVKAHGIPQGLAISNVLAHIYMEDVDASMSKLPVNYFRYVDDILVIGEKRHTARARRSLVARLSARGLKVHPIGSGKSHYSTFKNEFGYLGYRFRMPSLITVRDATVESLLKSIVARISDYQHNKARRLQRLSYLNEKRLREIFVLELNERITGAISEKRKYGWIAYFSEINDQELLFRIDHIVAGLLRRLPEFKGSLPMGLKRISRAFYEMKYRPTEGYVHNYDAFATVARKIQFLAERGRLAPDEALTEQQIEDRFELYRRRALAKLMLDESIIY